MFILQLFYWFKFGQTKLLERDLNQRPLDKRPVLYQLSYTSHMLVVSYFFNIFVRGRQSEAIQPLTTVEQESHPSLRVNLGSGSQRITVKGFNFLFFCFVVHFWTISLMSADRRIRINWFWLTWKSHDVILKMAQQDWFVTRSRELGQIKQLGANPKELQTQSCKAQWNVVKLKSVGHKHTHPLRTIQTHLASKFKHGKKFFFSFQYVQEFLGGFVVTFLDSFPDWVHSCSCIVHDLCWEQTDGNERL